MRIPRDVSLKYNVCYAVRLIYPKYVDTNTKEICTNHSKVEFAGINEAVSASDGVSLSWSLIPASGVSYLIFDTPTAGIYNFTVPLAVVNVAKQNSYKAVAVALGQTRCYMVRYYKESNPADNNSKEICVGESSLGDFAGIETATSAATGTIDITWKSAGSTIKNYRIYQGVDFSKLLWTKGTSDASAKVEGLLAGQTYEVGVRAVDASGREDANTKTIAVQVADFNAPTFAGVSNIEITGSRAFKVKWTAATPTPIRYDIFLAYRDAMHGDAALNCALATNSNACHDLIDWTAPVATATAGATEYSFSNVGDDQTVFAAVRAVSTSSVSDTNSIIKSAAIPDAGAPIFAGLTGAELIAGGKAKLTWSAPMGQVSNFRVTTTTGSTTITTIVPAMLPSGCTTACTSVLQEYTTPSLLSTTAYTFVVKAEDRSGAVDTNAVSRSVTTGDTIPPGVVSGISSVGLSENSVAISFTSPIDTDVNKYEVRYEKCLLTASYPTSCSGNLWGTKTLASIISPTVYTPSSSTSILVLGLEARTVYRFYARAVDTSGNTAVESATTKATLDTTAPVFAGITGAVQNSNYPSQIQITWDSPGGDVASYAIYRKQGSMSGLTLTRSAPPVGVEVITVTEPTALYNYTDLNTSGQTWYFIVHAVDDQGNEDSNAAQRSYTIPDLTPPAFDASTLTATWNAVQDGIVLNWTAPAGVAQYKLEAQCINVKESNGVAGVWPGIAPWPQSTNWVELAALQASATSYTLPRTGSSGTCAGAENRSYRFRLHARKATSDWDTNVTIAPSVTGATIPDITPPAWPTGAALTGVLTNDNPGFETIAFTWNEAVDTYINPVRNSTGLAGYDVYLVRNSAPWRVLVKHAVTGTLVGSNRTLNITYADMVSACDNPKTDPNATPGTAITDSTCRFAPMQNYTFAVRALDNAGNVHTQAQELAQASSTSIIDITPPVLTQVAVTSSAIYASQSTTLTFTSGEGGTYRVLVCTAACGSATPTYVSIDSGTMSATVQKSFTYAASAFLTGSGVKPLAIELTDALLNTIIYTASSTPAVPTVTINTPIISAVNVSPTNVSDTGTFSLGFTPNQSGTYRILECTVANCSSTSALAGISGTTTATTPIALTLSPTLFSAGSGTKILAVEVTDALGNIGLFTNATTPSVSSVYRNAAPSANISDFKILKYNVAGVATFKLMWTLPASITADEVVHIRKGTTTVPATCSTGTHVADATYNNSYYDIAVGSDTVDNVSYAAFVMNSASGTCVVSPGTSYGAVWTLSTSVALNSEAATGQYIVSTNLNNASVVAAEARSNAKITSWTGTNASTVCVTTGVGCGLDANIANSSYFGTSNTSLATANITTTLTYDYSNDTQNPIWSKRYHRLYFSNSTGNNLELSDVYNYAKVPTGMVYIAGNNWPQNVVVTGSSPTITESYSTSATAGDWDAVPHDFAIDKYEASLGSGTLGSPTTFPNTETGILVSANVTPLASKNWYSFKQGCLNRSYDAAYLAFASTGDLPAGTAANQSKNSSTIVNNPRRKYHLASGVEWTVAAYGTPDQGGEGYCNIDSRGTPASPTDVGTNSNVNCTSRFGARNMIGNLWEWTDDWAKNGKFGGINKWNGTTAEGMAATAPPASGNMAWNFRSQTFLPSITNTTINSDALYNLFEDGTTIEGGYGGGRGWAVLRGGDWNAGANAGRFVLRLAYSPFSPSSNPSGRCSIVAPQPTPRVARFASESDATTTKLSWVSLDTEDSTVIKLASASDKATIDTFNGTNAPAGVTLSTIALDATTGKHIGAGGCEGTYTPKAAGFESEVNTAINPAAVPPDNYWSGKYCATASGTKYYKLCTTNPSIAHVTDEYTIAQRTTCSAVVAVIASQALPAFAAYSNAAKLQNDSDGPFARFYFNASGGTNLTAKLVYGVNIDQVKRYNGDDASFSGFDTGTITSGVYYGTLSGVKTVTIPAGNTRAGGGGTADCDTAEYDPVATTWGVYEPFTGTNGITATHFACVNMSAYPKFTKMFFKVLMANTDGAGNITSGWVQSEVRGAGYVPTGMVYVTREEWQSIKNGGEDYTTWPVCVGAASVYPTFNHIKFAMPNVTGNTNVTTSGCVYDFAMDKYEAYVASGTITTGTFNSTNPLATDYNTSQSNASPASSAGNMTGNTSLGILGSAKAKTAASGNWFGFKKGCDNRTAQVVTQGFLASNASPTNNVRLPTGQEWTVAAYNTPDDGGVNTTCNVNTSARTTTAIGGFDGTGGMVKCVSTFGSYDHIGNMWEFTDEVTVNATHAASTNFYHLLGTSHSTAFPAAGNGSIPTLITAAGADNWVSTWDYLTGFPSSTTASTATSYYYWPVSTTVGPPAGGAYGANWAAVRGGTWSANSKSGRFTLLLSHSPSAIAWLQSSFWQIGGRCSMAIP